MQLIPKTLIILGLVFIIAGTVWHFGGDKIPLGRLPGDFRYEGKNFKFFFPITTSIIASIILTLVFQLINRLK